MAEDESKQGKRAPLIGILAVKKGFISEAQLQEALVQCTGDDDLEEKVKAYFLAENLISSQNVHRLTMAVRAVAIHRQEYRFGAIALARKVVSKSVLDLALEEQKEQFKKGKKPRPIGDVMVEAGIITVKQRDEILKLQNRSCVQSGLSGKPPSANRSEADGLTMGPDSPQASSSSSHITQGALQSDDGPVLDGLEQVAVICDGILLQVTCDHLCAFLSKMRDMDPEIPAVVIRTALAGKGVVYGLVSDDRIESFIKASIADSALFKVAQGVASSPGKDTEIEFFFNTEYLKTGGMDDAGNIDFKNWGPRPLVDKGTVLAEKISQSTPRHAKDVFGNDVPAVDKTDDPLRAGTGTVATEDGRKVLAAVRGAPRITLAGLIVVNEESDINGDIDPETVPVDVDCNIRVTGSIKSDARVCGVDVSAQDVENSIVEASGDLTIARGIKDARVYSRGNVYAQFIINSEIVCMGDVFVKREIVDSTIECAGACSVITGRVVSSRISAKMGLMARDIGSETADPSMIRVGHDGFAARELEKNSGAAIRLEEEIQNFDKKKNGIRNQVFSLKKQMNELERARDRILGEYREMESRGDLLSGDRDSLESRLTGVRNNLKASEAKMKMCAARIKDLVKQAAKMDRQPFAPAASQRALADEKKNLIRWSLHTPGKARVVVDGEIAAGTVIRGLHSSFVPKTDLCHVRITELPDQSEDGEDSQIFYRMQVDDL